MAERFVPEFKPGVVYRVFDVDGELLYIGRSFGPLKRLDQHRDKSPWWRSVARIEVEHFDDWFATARAERAAIATERPAFNVQFKREAAA